MERKLLTLVFVEKEGKVLLGMKKRGFGAGRWNGFGGKLLLNETLEEGACREAKEECGVIIKSLEEKGVLEFTWQGGSDLLEVHVFKATAWEGEPLETEEMRPQWFSVDQIPYESMWSDDPYWLGHFLAGDRFEGSFLFDENDQVLSQKVIILDKK